MVAISTPTAPTTFLINFTGLAKTARQQKAALTAGQRRRASKNSRHGWQADPIIRWKWRDCNARGFPCCPGLGVPKLQRNLFTISNRKNPLRLVACLASEPEGKLLQAGTCIKEKGREMISSPGLACSMLFHLVQAARTGWPTSKSGSAPFRGTNFCGRPPHTSAV